MSEVLLKLTECIAELGMEVVKNRLEKKAADRKVKERLKSYIEQQMHYNELCLLEEEIDFQCLIEYIQENLLNDWQKEIRCVDSNERQAVHNRIVDSAIMFSKAETQEAKLRAGKCVETCISIINGLFKNEIDLHEYILSDEIVDAININTVQTFYEGINVIGEKVDKLDDSINSLNYHVYKLSEGNPDDVNNSLNMIFDNQSKKHPLYPDFKCGWKNNHMISEPVTPEARHNNPDRYKLTGPMKIDGKYISDLPKDVLNYAYRHQLQLVMEIEDAEKYLGDIKDPYQYEANEMIGGTLAIKPPEFPPAFACSIKVNDNICFEYVLFRTQEILDDGSFIISNKEQRNTHFRFEIKVNVKELTNKDEGEAIGVIGDNDFKITIQDATHPEILKYLRFIKAAVVEKNIRIHVLESGHDLIIGKIDGTDYHSDIQSIDEEIDFWDRVCDIEKYFNISLNIKNEILEKDYRIVLMLSDLIRNDKCESTWSKVTFTFVSDDRFRRNMIEMKPHNDIISYVGISKVNLFGTQIEFKLMNSYYDVTIDEYERIKKLVELSGDGDTIRITLCAGENNRVICTLNIPEKALEEVGLK